MIDNGVELYFNDAIERVEGNKIDYEKRHELLKLILSRQASESFRIRQLAESIGLTIGETKGIVVNDYMQTNDPDIYAIGDVAEMYGLAYR